jgi:transposase
METTLREENTRLKKELEFQRVSYESTIENYQEEVVRLQDLLRKFKRMQFGKKSERVEDLEESQLVFNEVEVESRSGTELSPEATKTITYTRKQGRQSRKPFPDDLEREVIYHDLSEEEKQCPHHGEPLREIGEEVVEKLVTYPARMVLREERTKKYVASCCESPPKQAKVNSILPGTIATPELLSFIIFSKFFQALPLYRLEELFALFGVELSRGTMARWMIQVSEKLLPVWNVLEERAFESGYLCIDATSVQVLKETGRKAESKSFMWCRGSPEKGIVLFDYNVSGAGYVAEKLIAGFAGALQSDAHRGYDRLSLELFRLGCFMHARRRFFEAAEASKKGAGLSHEGLAYIQRLYDLEESYKEKALSPEERKVARDNEQVPLLDSFKKWALTNKSKVPPQSLIGNAISYLIAEWDFLTAYLKDGRYEIDNGWVERAIRKFAIGRNNWLFSDSVEGANATSILYSVVITAKLNGKDPFTAMVEILKQLPFATSIDDYERLADLLLTKEKPPIGKDGKTFHYKKSTPRSVTSLASL